MNAETPVGPHVVEVSLLVIPADGVTLDQALADLNLTGHLRIDRHDDGTATVVLYEETTP